MKITLITVGKIKEKYLKDAIAEYSKRLSKYCKLEIVEVADEKTPDQASENVERQIRQKEGERILRYVKDDAYVFTLEIGGTMLDSVAFAKKMETLGIQGKSHLIFIIGGSIGLGGPRMPCVYRSAKINSAKPHTAPKSSGSSHYPKQTPAPACPPPQ